MCTAAFIGDGYAPTAEVFHKPKSLRVARAFSDPPMNLVSASGVANGIQLEGGVLIGINPPANASRDFTVGVRANVLRTQKLDGDVAIAGKVELAEISGSDTYLHVATLVGDLVAQLTGVHYFDLGREVTLYLQPSQVYLFDARGLLVQAPEYTLGR